MSKQKIPEKKEDVFVYANKKYIYIYIGKLRMIQTLVQFC